MAMQEHNEQKTAPEVGTQRKTEIKSPRGKDQKQTKVVHEAENRKAQMNLDDA